MVRFPVIESVDQEGATVAGGGGGGTTSAVPPGWFVPETYGAVGDGTTDDTVALNACIAAAEAYGTGATVLLSKATYAHAGPLAIMSPTVGGLRITGTGGRLQWTDGPTLKFTGGQGTGALTTLNGALTGAQTTITTNAPAPAYLGDGKFTILIDSEIMWVYSGATTTTWTVRRGFLNTAGATHLSAASVGPGYGALMVGSPFGLTLQNFRVVYTNAAFTGNLVDFDWYPPNFGDPTNWEIQGCAFRSTGTGVQGARSLIRLNHTIIGRIEACHLGERNGPGILCGDGNYCVSVQIRDNTWNSGLAGTFCVQTSAGAEAILMEGNTFEAVAGTYPGAWRHVGGAAAWHVTFRDNWMGDQATNVLSAPTGLAAAAVGSGGTFAAGSYFWKVTALNINGETVGSTEATATLALNGSCNLSWAAVTGATSYKVYRSTTTGTENVSPALVSNPTTNSYTDTGTAVGAGAVPAANTAEIPWIQVDGQLNSFNISNNRFTTPATIALFTPTSTPQGGLITGNHCDNGPITFVSGASVRAVHVFGNYAPGTITGIQGVNLVEGVTGGSPNLGFQAFSSSPLVGIGTGTAQYALDVFPNLSPGSRLLGKTFVDGTAGNADGAKFFQTYNPIGIKFSCPLAQASSTSHPSPGSLDVGMGYLALFDDASGTLRWQVAQRGSSVGAGPNFVGNYLIGTTTWNPASVASGAITTTTVTVTNAVVGQPVSVGFPFLVAGVAATAGLTLTGQVSAASTVTVVLRNDTGGAVDLDSGTLEALVWQH